jgi:phenylpropionate dioxygenase-like ring-hydroxylating dioxygenase large terminal subunit
MVADVVIFSKPRRRDASLSQMELDAITRPLGEASNLPAKCYTDPDFYAFEVQRVFMRNWLPVGRIDQLSNPGDYFTAVRFGEPIVVLKDKENTIRAFSNVCRHRNFPVAEGAGNCRAGRFVCRYHGWSYDLTGQLRAAPFMDRTESFSADQWRLPQLGIDVWQGFIFVNFDASAPLLSSQLKTLDNLLGPTQLADMKTTSLRRVKWPGNWKSTLENFTESYHQPIVHPKTFEPWAPAKLSIYEDVDGPYNLFWMPSGDGSPIKTVYPLLPNCPQRLKTAFLVVNIFPYFHFLIDPGCAISLDMNINGAEDLECHWSVHVPPDVHALADFEQRTRQLLELLMPTYNEDESACQRILLGQRSRFTQQGKYSWMEKSVHQFHTWLAREYARPTD